MVRSCQCTNSSDGCREAERKALLKLKQSFNDPGDKLSSWEGINCCQWDGVACDSKTGYVFKLDLQSNFNKWMDISSNNVFDVLAASKLDSSLLELSYLNYLDLSGNNFNESPIPEFLLEMNGLKHLNLSSTNFTTSLFPLRLGSLANLQVLDLSIINLSGVRNLLPTINKLHSLLVLSLSGCTLDDAHLSSNFSNLTFLSSLQELHLPHNSFISFPLLLKNMTSLRVLDFSKNDFNCSIPMWLTDLKELEYLDLSWNQFNKVEAGLWRLLLSLCHLKTIDFSENPFQLESLESNKNISRGCIGYDLEELYARRGIDMNSLDMNSGLNSRLIDELGQFKKLKYLDFSGNQLHGAIPTTIGNLTALIEINLYHNKLNGTIPDSIGNLPSLKILDLSQNDLTGTIPTTIGNLSALTKLHLMVNLLSGVVPDSIGQLFNLERIDLSSNDLTCNISETHFLNVTKLIWLNLGSNQLTITISHDWIPPFQLEVMDMRSCKFDTVFPRWLETQKELQWLYLSNASITGPWPTFFQCSLLDSLDLSHNEISGHIPRNIRDLFPTLSKLQLSNNLLNGTIPSSLCKIQSVNFLDISRNMLSGNIPNCLWDIQNMNIIKLSFNKLTGAIPSSFGNLSNIEGLLLDNNRLKGDIPSSLRNCKRLVVVNLGENKLSGNIPTWIGGMGDLQILKLRNNRFDGYMPKQLCQMLSLRILDLADNNFTGNIPSCLDNLTTMSIKQLMVNGEYISMEETVAVMIKRTQLEYATSLRLVVNVDLSCNNLVGVIPPEITRLSALIGLNLSYNHLTGTIPKNIGNLTALESLDLSNNRLSGSIPIGMSLLDSLGSLNLSHNNFSGPLPIGNHLQTLTDNPSTYADNPNLCGTPLTKRCAGDEPVHGPDSNEENDDEEEDKYDKVWLYLAITSGYAVGLWTFFGILFFKKKWRYAYFRHVDYANDWIYVFVVVNARRLKRKLMGVQE